MGSHTCTLDNVHKILDKLFVAMEENSRHRGALRFPEMNPAPARRGPLAKMLSMVPGWAKD